ncbi:hypothetical protein ACFP2T_38285 [Plantactinospora solaniradicis]|uniref:M6 family metalloprotease domain-containing protein n=1 Tax=Plantactinospora solaniradicis TaxID=1723736 RepID=A0ABW1KJQ4_9ACTN
MRVSQVHINWHSAQQEPHRWREVGRRLRTLLSAVALLSAALAVPTVAAPPGPAQAASAADCALPGPSTPSAREHPGMLTDYEGRWKDPIGNHRGIVLFVDFSNAIGDPVHIPSLRSLYAPAAGWFDISSYGRTKLDVTWDSQWRRMPLESDDYHDPEKSVTSTFDRHRTFMKAAVTAADPYVDFTGYDFVYVIVPPDLFNSNFHSAAYITWASSTSDFLDTAEGSPRLGVTLGSGVEQGQRLFVHETAHLFGLPDLYSLTPEGHGSYAALGGWDLMSMTSSNAPDHLAWQKWKLGWLDNSQVYCMDTHARKTWTLTPLHASGGPKMAVVRTAPNRAVVVEYRATGGPIDGNPGRVSVPGCFQPGVLVYTVDANLAGLQEPIKAIDAEPMPNTGDHCPPDQLQLSDATMVSLQQAVIDPESGVEVRLTGIGSGTRTVQVSWP